MSALRHWPAVVRPLAAVGLAVGLTAAAANSSGAIVLGAPPSGSAGALGRSTVPVREALAVCPGPETEGLSSVPGVAGMLTSVSAASAPDSVLAALGAAPPQAPGGVVRLLRRPLGGELGALTTRGGAVGGTVTGATLVEVAATESLAPAVAGLQTSVLAGESDDRGLAATPCATPSPDVWLLAGGGDATRRERLVVANPGANTLTVDVEVYGAAGKRVGAAAGRLAVPPHGRVSLLLDALAAGESSPAVHVTATGGVITAVLEDAWIEGAVGRGRDDSAAAAAPALEQVVPATVLAGPAHLRLLVPGPDEAVVLARLLTPDGPLALPGGGVSRVKGGTVLDVDLGSVAPGDYAIQIRSDQPVTAAVLVQRLGADGKGPSDLAWVPATPSLAATQTLTGSPVPAGAAAQLVLAGTGGPWRATLTSVGPDGTVSSRIVEGSADSSASNVVTGAAAVWVVPMVGTVYAGLSLSLPDPVGPLYAAVGLAPIPVLTAAVPVRSVRR